MRSSFLTFLLAGYGSLLTLGLMAQGVGINTDGSAPDASAILDVKSTDRGFLVPRVALTATNSAAPVTSPATGLLVYNTATAGTFPNNVTPGFYYWDGTQWRRLDPSNQGDWRLTGNAGASPSINFLGTTDAQPLIIRTNNLERIHVASNGNVGIGNTNPDHLLVVGPAGGGRHLVINDIAQARWGFATGGFALSIQNDYGGTWNTRVLIDQNGQVGIGTTSPFSRLHVRRPSGENAVPDIRSDEGTYWTHINSRAPVGSWNPLVQAGDHSFIYSNGAIETGALVIGQWSDSPKGIRIDGAGNVGVGLSIPSERLHVSGNVRISGLAGSGNRPVYADPNGTLTTSSGGLAEGAATVIPLALFGGEPVINSTSWQRVTRTTYTPLVNLFSAIPVPPGATRKYYLIIRKADTQPGGVGSYWRFSCDGAWNGGNDVAGHGFTLPSDWGSASEGSTHWIEIPANAVTGSGCGTGYWKIDARMANAGPAMRVMSVSLAAVDVVGGSTPPYSAATGGNAVLPGMSWLYENVWSTGTAGNVGIGIANPIAKLNVVGGLVALGVPNGGGSYAIPNTCGGNWLTGVTSGIYAPDPVLGCGDEWYIASYPRGGEARTLEIAIRNDGDDHIALMPSGNVGIGTINPSFRLQVEGVASAQVLNFGAYDIADPGFVDGQLYRTTGQAVVRVDDWFYIRDNDNANRIRINTDAGRIECGPGAYGGNAILYGGYITGNSTSDGHRLLPNGNAPGTIGWGYVGQSNTDWYYMYSDNYTNTSRREKKRNITVLDETLVHYVINDIKRMKPCFYKYKGELDEYVEGYETRYRPNMHLGVLLDETPDYLQDQAFSGVDIYALGVLALTGVKFQQSQIEEIQTLLKSCFAHGYYDQLSQEVVIHFPEDFNTDNQIPFVAITPTSGSTSYYVSEITPRYFVVKSQNPFSFTWMALVRPSPSLYIKKNVSIPAELKHQLEVEKAKKERIQNYWKQENEKLKKSYEDYLLNLSQTHPEQYRLVLHENEKASRIMNMNEGK